jgi:hypothetical protein
MTIISYDSGTIVTKTTKMNDNNNRKYYCWRTWALRKDDQEKEKGYDGQDREERHGGQCREEEYNGQGREEGHVGQGREGSIMAKAERRA